MRIVIGNFNFIRPAGTEMWVMTVGERLSRLGHDVHVFAMETGPLADVARKRGMRVTSAPRELPDTCDAIVVQDGPTSYALAARYPDVAQILKVTSTVFDISHPPRLPGLVVAAVALNDRTYAHIGAFNVDVERVRLRQPVDLDRFAPRSPLPARPRRALLLGNYLRGPRRDLLAEAWGAEGVELVQVGRHGSAFRTDPEAAMNEADIVVGRARVIVEAMACGRAAYIYDEFGTDGWVTADSYATVEANNFSGYATDRVPDAATLRADLAAYSPDMGLVNRDLARIHHDHTQHAEGLVAVLERHARTRTPVEGPLEEMAWLARQNWLTESRAYDLGIEAARLAEALEEERRAHAATRSELDAARRPRAA